MVITKMSRQSLFIPKLIVSSLVFSIVVFDAVPVVWSTVVQHIWHPNVYPSNLSQMMLQEDDEATTVDFDQITMDVPEPPDVSYSYVTADPFGVQPKAKVIKRSLEYLARARQLRMKRQAQQTNNNCLDEATVMGLLLNNSNYDPNKLPSGGGVDVMVELWVQEVSKIIEFTSEFELDIYVTEQWVDHRLAFSSLGPCKANISVDGGAILPKIWNPRACFVNSKNASIHESPFTNIFLMIYDNGTVWVNYRIKLVGPCKKDLKTFPIDEQSCALVYESFTHNYGEVRMAWTTFAQPVLLLKEIKLPDYTLVNYSATQTTRLYPPGVWVELIATFTFQRRYGFYILQAYVPAYLSVFISWVSFYLGAKNLASRTTVGVNSLLSLTFQFGSIVNNLPRTSDVKAIDVWILSCMSFIFGTLIELAFVGWITRWNVNNGIRCSCSWMCMDCPYWTANKIDGLSMIAFPTCFLLFNLYYWGVFLG